nr:MAG TPA: hypothetical protein [Caudoviricetes sp.]
MDRAGNAPRSDEILRVAASVHSHRQHHLGEQIMLINLNIEIKDASEAEVQRLTAAMSVALAAAAGAAEEKPAPAPKKEEKKAEEKPAPAPKKEEKKAEEKPAPAPTEDGDSDEGLLDVAVKRATALLAEGDTTPVKEALKAAGARRVSQLKGDAIRVFLDALPQEA